MSSSQKVFPALQGVAVGGWAGETAAEESMQMCRTSAGKQNAEHVGLLLQMDRPCRSLQWAK